MSQLEILEALPQQHRKHLDPASPAPLRMMAAKGMAPLPPREMVLVLLGLCYDGDDKLSAAARASLAKLPDKILAPALEQPLPPSAFAAVAPAVIEREPLLEKLVLNRATPDAVIAMVAPTASASVAEIIAGNQERCLRSEAVVAGIRQNTNIMRSSLDRLFDFLVRSGVIYDGVPELADALGRLSPQEMQAAVEKVELPADVAALLNHARDASTDAKLLSRDVDRQGSASEEEELERVPVLKLIRQLNVAQKVALAMRGNKEARVILLRDSNRMVASAAIRSPRITEQEVVTAAQSRSVADDVIRVIANSREMTRSYTVKLALVNNPKTPLPTAMRYLSLLRQNDLRTVAKSKNISQAVANQAKKLMLAKTGGR